MRRSARREDSRPAPPRPATLDAKLDQIQRYLPQHITEKIVVGRGRLEGERKLVTVLFADLSGYTTLSEKLGEEALFATMDELYERLIHEVHRYEGTVNEGRRADARRANRHGAMNPSGQARGVASFGPCTNGRSIGRAGPHILWGAPPLRPTPSFGFRSVLLPIYRSNR